MRRLCAAHPRLGQRAPQLASRPVCSRLATNSSFAQASARRQLSSSHGLSVLKSQARSGPHPGRANSSWLKGATVVGVGLGVSALQLSQPLHCEPPPPAAPLPPPPQSSVNVYELSFGTVCGVCAGVFIKKGAKALAFVLGGVFVLLQYMGSRSVVKVDWSAMGSRFENLFYTTDPATGTKRAPNVISLYRWLVDFLTANFQQRASFVAGLALGLRIG
ncbi:hypothetical protein PUNSTDRAFT_136159 [Punctularia strigosozonata HHB-11173 SS5]|uniref:uncharacterized protein n=1 Tax=Punctularia strigosozonata (strain HHB-11173) TaxID=741275 RepID=UPI0004417370|nr:uncharacterized protein PUNSTDRAFT_136159 [Punctularia strigosozonata HHB-11173 SS5]EIN07479.1 hypothetical protein PUNSTDRAFT_136159 [Punctularia strigosozonata HHB-11173 SS5]